MILETLFVAGVLGQVAVRGTAVAARAVADQAQKRERERRADEVRSEAEYRVNVRVARELVRDYPQRGTFEGFEAAVSLVREADAKDAEERAQAAERKSERAAAALRAQELADRSAKAVAAREAARIEAAKRAKVAAQLRAAEEARKAHEEAEKAQKEAVATARATLDRADREPTDPITLKHAQMVLDHYGASRT